MPTLSTKTISREQLLTKIEHLKETGAFFTVWFTKKDGTERKLNGRFGIKKYLHGGKATISENKFFIVFDMKAKGYRAVNKDTIFKLRASNNIYELGV